MSVFSCLACHVTFDNADLHRNHYKDDWHCFNIERKSAGLSALTLEAYNLRAAEQQTLDSHEKMSYRCCGSSFITENSYKNHLKSSKHRERTAKAAALKAVEVRLGPTSHVPEMARTIEEEGSGTDEDEYADAIPPSSCLFCNKDNESLEKNMAHMTSSHSFFIPDLDYVVDLEGLIEFLGYKVGVGYVCLYCNTHSRNFSSIEAVQKHMQDKGHCMLDSSGDAMLEFSDFYDYSSSYPDFQNPEEGSSEVGLTEPFSVCSETLELCLPNGVRIGHRSMRLYYLQNLPSERRARNDRARDATRSLYRELGCSDRALHASLRQKIRDVRLQNTRDSYKTLGIGMNANKLQRHYRRQYGF